MLDSRFAPGGAPLFLAKWHRVAPWKNRCRRDILAVGDKRHMVNLSRETETLIAAKAARAGRTPDEIVRDALERTGNVVPWRNSVKPLPDAMTKAELIAEMEGIAARSAAR
ncbi:MAG TPA: hypothetical protein VFQ87_05140, partial [Bradyrhizobium sp.]|nr:hypothetical protein [Bradyrhizobium sp.]